MVDGYPGVVNENSATDMIYSSLCGEFDASLVRIIDTPTMTTEDFGFYLMKKRGAFFHIGVGGEYPLHSPNFLPSDEVLPLSAAAEARIIYEACRSL